MARFSVKSDCYSVYSSKSSFPTPQMGHTQSSGKSSKDVPGSMPPSLSPNSGLYTQSHTLQIYFFIRFLLFKHFSLRKSSFNNQINNFSATPLSKTPYLQKRLCVWIELCNKYLHSLRWGLSNKWECQKVHNSTSRLPDKQP